MKSFFRYPGGKSRLYKQLKNHFVFDFDCLYIEPFVGAGGALLNVINDFYDVGKIKINDLDMGISALWTSVINYPEDLIDMVKSFKPTVEKYYEFKTAVSDTTNSDDIVKYGFMKLALHQMSYSGLGLMSGGPLGGTEQKSEYTIDCRWSPDNIVQIIRNTHELLKTKEIINNSCTSYDYRTVLKYRSPTDFVYLDPPYYVKGSELYNISFDENDHVDLCGILKGANFNWVLSYDDCPEIRDLYCWANVTKIEVNYMINNIRSTSEIIICPN